MKVACEASVGKRDSVNIFGTDYPTPDGTGVRDYIHVQDLARAHLSPSTTLQLAENRRRSTAVTDMGTACARCCAAWSASVAGPLQVPDHPRRAGDPPILVARADRIRSVLGWKPELDDLDGIVASSLRWEEKQLKDPW